MYKDGANYQEIAHKLKISQSIVDEYILAHASLLKIDMNELELQHKILRTIDESLVIDSYPSPVNNVTYDPAEPLAAITRAYPKQEAKCTWFQKAKTILCQIICFWK